MTDHDLADLLDRATRDVPEPDCAERAWAQAATRRRSQLLTVSSGLAAGFGVAIVLAVVQGGQPQTATPPIGSASGVGTATSAPTNRIEDGRAVLTVRHTATDGSEFLQGPTREQLAGLPIDPSFPTDLRPPVSGPELAAVVQGAGSAAADLRVVAAVAAPSVGDSESPYTVWLAVRGGARSLGDSAGLTWARVPGTFPSPNPVNGGQPLTARSIDPSGTKVAIVEARGVTVVDVTTGGRRSVAVPTDSTLVSVRLTDAGYADDGTLVAWGGDYAFRASPADQVLHRVSSDVRPDAVALSDSGARPTILRYAKDHTLETSVRLATAFSFLGPSASNDQWVVRGGFPDLAKTPPDVALLNGLLAATVDGTTVRILVMDERLEETYKGGLVVYGSRPGSPHLMVFGFRTAQGSYLATWDLGTDTVGYLGAGAPAAIWLGGL